MRKKIILIILTLISLVVFFYPKNSSQIQTGFAVQQFIDQGMSENEAENLVNMQNRTCTCLGFELPTYGNSYKTTYACFGWVVSCMERS